MTYSLALLHVNNLTQINVQFKSLTCSKKLRDFIEGILLHVL